MGKFISTRVIRGCVSTIIVILFIAALFAAGMAVYAGLAKITYPQAWTNLITAIRTAFNL